MLRKSFTLVFCISIVVSILPACAASAEITPTSIIEATEQNATPLPITPTSTKTTITPIVIPPEVISEVESYLTKIASEKIFAGAVLIADKSQVLLSNGYGLADREKNIKNTAQTRFRIGSITKQFTAMAVLILEYQGKLSVLDPICNYVSDCPAEWQSISIENLLTHTSGIPDFISMAKYAFVQATPSAPENTILRFKDLPLEFQPGEKWSYSNSNYILLGTIIERASGQTYEDFLQQYVFTRLDLKNTGYDHNSDTVAVGYSNQYSSKPASFLHMSIPYAAGALYSSVEDLYQWDRALSAEKLIPRAYLDAMFAPHAEIPDLEGYAYGYGWNIGTENGRRVIEHMGGINGFVSINSLYPDDQVVIIILSNQANSQVSLMKEIIAGKIFGD